MALPTDTLPPQSLPIAALSKGLQLTTNGAAISARVIASTALPTTNSVEGGNSSHNVSRQNAIVNNIISGSLDSGPRYEILLATARGKLLVASNSPLAPGTSALLKMAAQGLVLTVKPNTAAGPAANTSKTMLSSPTAPTVAPAPGGQLQRTAAIAQQYSNSQVTASAGPNLSQLIDSGIRQALPLQQSSALLVPLLQQLSAASASQSLPAPIKGAIEALLQQLPSAKSLQQVPQLKAAIGNSGIFLEAKLAQLSTAGATSQGQSPTTKTSGAFANRTGASGIGTSGAAASGSGAKQSSIAGAVATTTVASGNSSGASAPRSGAAQPAGTAGNIPKSRPQPILQQDFKALGQKLLAAIEPAAIPAAAAAKTPATTAATIAPTAPLLGSLAAEAVPALAPREHSTEQQAVQSAAREASQNMDIALRQLGRQLLATLAKTQLNQLESLATRATNNPDSPGVSNNWTLEIPILNGRHVDTMELRIDREEEHSEQQDDETSDEKLWTVMLDFDLHTLGKMNIQLKVLGKTVTATIWSELEHTHREVKQQLQDLRDKLSAVGVEVKQVECKLGTPPPRSTLSQRQLVDVTT